jgi:F0F1-type ATP synthase membrane subunit b/b'
MELFWVMLIFFLFITIVFVVIAFLYPEWVGITGKKALEIQKHQLDDNEANLDSKNP